MHERLITFSALVKSVNIGMFILMTEMDHVIIICDPFA